MAATDFVTENQLDSLTTTIATSVKGNTTAVGVAQTTADDHISDAAAAHAASAISVLDTGTLYTGTNVEACLAEVRTVADAAAGGGVAINDLLTNTSDAWSSQKITDEIAASSAALVDSSPATLDTLNELAASLGDDANFAATMTTALGNRLRVDAAQGLSAPQMAQGLSNLGIVQSSVDFAAAFTAAIA